MTPAQPPFPTDCSLRFQFEVGSQTSTLISESLEGLRVAATRQNSGRSLYALAVLPFPAALGWENCPAGTICAIVMVASGSASEARLSHVAANAGDAIANARNGTSLFMI